jgi:hypothetical protein
MVSAEVCVCVFGAGSGRRELSTLESRGAQHTASQLLTVGFVVFFPSKYDRNFAFLQALSHDFGARYNKRRIKVANSYSMDKEFKPIVRVTMHHYNINRSELSRDEQVNALLAKVEDLKNVLGRNLELLLHREGQLDSLMVKSEKARRDSMVFKKQSNKAMKHTRMKSYKMWYVPCACSCFDYGKRSSFIQISIDGFWKVSRLFSRLTYSFSPPYRIHRFLICFGFFMLLITIMLSVCGVGLEHCRSSGS